jgi:hypothetical protein
MSIAERFNRTERLTILVSTVERAAITERADRLGVSSSEVLRLAFDAYRDQEAVKELEVLAGALEDTVIEMRESLAETRRELAVTLAEFRAGRKVAA